MKKTRVIVATGVTAGLLIAGLAINPRASSGFAPPEGAYDGGFMISNQQVIPDTRYIARYRVLGAEISAGGAYDMPVTLAITISGQTFEPFGSYADPVGGNVNDDNHPKDFVLEDHYPANSSFHVRGRSWKKDGSGGWRSSMEVSTSLNSPNMLVLRNGDLVPEIPPFLDQDEISFIVRDYVDPATNRVRIYEDEVIMLFELGTTNLEDAAADFQDLVLLVTLADDPAYFDKPRFQPNTLYD